jgi:hypothetical protein
VLEELRALYAPDLRVITPAKIAGTAAARSGFAQRPKVVFYTDGDGQYDVEGSCTELLELVAPGTGLVNGYKLARSGAPRVDWQRVQFCARFLFHTHPDIIALPPDPPCAAGEDPPDVHQRRSAWTGAQA